MGQDSDIVVTAWSQRYATAFSRLLGIEGGHVNDPVDRGGETKYGISLRFLKAEGKLDLDGDGRADFDLDFDGDIDGADIRKLTIGDARYLYHRCFWKPLAIEGLARPIGEMVFDQAVNGGLRAAGKMLQRAINRYPHSTGLNRPLAVDGAIGDITRAALNRLLERGPMMMPRLVESFREQVKARYLAIIAADPSQAKYRTGWLRRADELGRGW